MTLCHSGLCALQVMPRASVRPLHLNDLGPLKWGPAFGPAAVHAFLILGERFLSCSRTEPLCAPTVTDGAPLPWDLSPVKVTPLTKVQWLARRKTHVWARPGRTGGRAGPACPPVRRTVRPSVRLRQVNERAAAPGLQTFTTQFVAT
jgi:hypothetical protein